MLPLQPGTRPPWVIAHRGASVACPENTFAAFDRALEEGCDAIELDVQLTRDGVAVVFHDDDLLRICRLAESVGSLTLAQLRGLDVGGWFAPGFAGERMPLLAQVLERYAGRTRLFVELKHGGEGLVEAVIADLSEAAAAASQGGVCLLSFHRDLLEHARRLNPAVALGLNLRAPADGPFDALSVDIRRLSAPSVGETHASGRPVLCFTCNTEEEAGVAIRAGVDALFSDRPGWLMEYRNKAVEVR